MRYDAEHKERTRQGLLSEAATAIRLKGPERVGVAEVMATLGLTHGGFYAHFKSKDELVAEAIGFMFEQSYEWFQSLTDSPEPQVALATFIHAYLSRAHRDARDRGCAIATLAADSPRLPEAARARFSEGADRLPKGIAKLLKKMGAKNAEALAYSAVAEMIGALNLSRVITDIEQSDRILRNSRDMLKARLGLGVAK